MDIRGWTKNFLLKVLNKIEEHVATVLAGAIFLIGSVLCIVFWEWAKTEHSLELYGWVWLSISLLFLLLLIYSLYSVCGKFRRIKEPSDVRNALSKWWRHCTDQCPQKEFALYFAAIDRKEKLKRGSAKKYLREIIVNRGNWSIVREGSKTLAVRRKEYTFRVDADGTLTS